MYKVKLNKCVRYEGKSYKKDEIIKVKDGDIEDLKNSKVIAEITDQPKKAGDK